MTARRFLYAFVILAVLHTAWRWDRRAVEHDPGVLVPDAPTQVNLITDPFVFDQFQIMPRAEFDLYARVLSAERYRFDAGARLSPIDLALGWGPMSDQAVLDQVRISQGARWFTMSWKAPPIPPVEMMRHSANMHMIPAEAWVEDALKDARVGDIVQLRGFLVDVTDNEGWSWRTSLSRDDTGGGSCELVFVEYVSLLTDPKLLTRN